jgi:hypothetical protein
MKDKRDSMWQRHKSAYHLLPNWNAGIGDGAHLQTACGTTVKVNSKMQLTLPVFADKRCQACYDIQCLAFSSINDAKSLLTRIKDVKTLRQALLWTSSKTARKMIEARINKLDAQNQKERKLRLVAKAFE